MLQSPTNNEFLFPQQYRQISSQNYSENMFAMLKLQLYFHIKLIDQQVR